MSILLNEITVGKPKADHGLEVLSTITGWSYVMAWSLSFYPQIYNNWKRKSVVGQSLDYVGLNAIGHSMYGLFNISMYWCPEIKHEYFIKHPKGVIPVHLDDVAFSVHATTMTLTNVFQGFIYERGGQKVSLIGKAVMGILLAAAFVSLILSFFHVFNWLEFIYICSYVKLCVTAMKYIPQVLMNYKRKSTTGYSIGTALCDFTGGMLSMLQMIINAANYEDLSAIFGDPTKFGLGLLSVMFDIVLMIQHYVLYGKKDKEPALGEKSYDADNQAT